MATEGNSFSAAETSVRKAASPNVSTSRGHLSQPKPRRGLSSTHEGRTSLGYADVGLFFVFVFFIAAFIRVGVHFHILNQATVDRPPLFLQIAISLALITALYWTVRIGTAPESGRCSDGVAPTAPILLPPSLAGLVSRW